MNDDDRRRTPRHPTDFKVAVKPPDERVVEGSIRDVSAGGVFISSAELLPTDTVVRVSAVAVDHTIFSFGAKIVRVVDEGEGAGMGLQFVEVGPQALLALRQQLKAGARVRINPSPSKD